MSPPDTAPMNAEPDTSAESREQAIFLEALEISDGADELQLDAAIRMDILNP